MKSSLRKLRDFAWHKHGSKARKDVEIAEEPAELTKGMQDLELMRAQYEGLLTAAQLISSSAFDFAVALQDMATYMIESFGQIAEGKIGTIFSMLGKVQYEVAKLLELHAAHVSQTFVLPVESLLCELQHVEVMKGQYDEKRQLYNQVISQKPRTKPKEGNGDGVQHLAKHELEEVAVHLGLRLQSLKKGQILSLITEAVRYQTAQRIFFSRGSAVIDAVEPFAEKLAYEHTIDRTLSEGHSGFQDHEAIAGINIDLLEKDFETESATSSSVSVKVAEAQKSINEPVQAREALKRQEESSKSAPISMFHQTDTNLKIKDLSLDTPFRKYALPRPSGPGASWSNHVSGSHMKNQGQLPFPISGKRDSHAKGGSETSQLAMYSAIDDFSLELKDSLNSSRALQQSDLSADSAEEKSCYSQVIQKNSNVQLLPIGSRKYSHSGPLIGNKAWPGTKHVTESSSVFPQADHLSKSGGVNKSPIARAFHSPRISPSVSPPHLSPPRVNELHKLPSPPQKSLPIIAYSAPLRRQYPSSKQGQALPPPSSAVFFSRTLSTPSSADHTRSLQLPSEPPSPPLKPMVL